MEMPQIPPQEMPQVPQEQQMPEEAGRGGDTVIGHLSLGELIIPRAFLDDVEFSEVMKRVFQHFGADINEFTVGHPTNKINPETGYPEFGFFKKIFKGFKSFIPALNIGQGWNKFRDSVEGSAVLLGNYLLPGSSMLTSKLVSSGAQKNLDSPFGKLANIGTGLTGGGVGESITGIPSASNAGYGWTNFGNSAGGLVGSPNLGTNISNALGSATGGIIGSSGPASSFTDIDGLSSAENSFLKQAATNTGGSTVGSSLANALSASSLASGVGGYANDMAIKKAKKAQELANLKQLQNLETFDPSQITSQPGYQFNLEQGQKGLNKALGAQGSLFSGKALKAAAEYNQNYANNAYKDYYNQWAQKTGAQNALYGDSGTNAANYGLLKSNNLASTLANMFNQNQKPWWAQYYG